MSSSGNGHRTTGGWCCSSAPARRVSAGGWGQSPYATTRDTCCSSTREWSRVSAGVAELVGVVNQHRSALGNDASPKLGMVPANRDVDGAVLRFQLIQERALPRSRGTRNAGEQSGMRRWPRPPRGTTRPQCRAREYGGRAVVFASTVITRFAGSAASCSTGAGGGVGSELGRGERGIRGRIGRRRRGRGRGPGSASASASASEWECWGGRWASGKGQASDRESGRRRILEVGTGPPAFGVRRRQFGRCANGADAVDPAPGR